MREVWPISSYIHEVSNPNLIPKILDSRFPEYLGFLGRTRVHPETLDLDPNSTISNL